MVAVGDEAGRMGSMEGMERLRGWARLRGLGRLPSWGILCVCVAAGSSGCTARLLTISQDEYINTKPYVDRERGARTGDPMEVDIVCVLPADLDDPANELLRPGSGITSDVWYKKRPTQPGGGGDTFNLPSGQIHLFTDRRDIYGVRAGSRLKGSVADQKEKFVVRVPFGSAFGSELFSSRSAIYVFPRFLDKEGRVLPVKPVVFSPPGAWTKNISVKIGVDDPEGRAEQYIEMTTARKKQ